MITKLKLTNFKKHESLEIDLGSGLQALRGANEAGKSTVFRAIAYALFGSRALELSLEDTVTWGKPVSSLKVDLAFNHNNVEYAITRKKSGAELVGSNGVTASGQAEVTAFVERLFGANAAIAQATMLANQSSLQDGLDSSAMPLIEKLANMRLIDELIDKVQQKLPSGSTKGLESQIHAMSEILKPTLDTTADEQRLKKMHDEIYSYRGEIIDAEFVLDGKMLLAKSGNEKQAKNDKASKISDFLQQQIADAKQKLVVPAFEKPNISAMEEALKQQETREQLVRAFVKFSGLVVPENKMPAKEFAESHEELTLRIAQYAKEFSDARVQLALAKASLITESSCTFCGKNFSDVPEVSKKIDDTQRLIKDIEERMEVAKEERLKLETKLVALDRLRKQSDAFRKLFPMAHVQLDESTIPPTPVWVGGEVASETPIISKADVDSAKASIKNHERLVSQAEAAQATLDKAQADLAAVETFEIGSEELEAMLTVDNDIAEIDEAKEKLREMEAKYKDQQHKIALAQNTFKLQTEAYEKSLKQKQELLDLLSNYHFNNGIISKLREARPAVAAKLWALVLTGVSHYFSAIRGTQSTVTRGEKGFLIDSKAVEAYSGSTKDSLGLAIRIMLQKTFLPNVTFMLVDEPGAAFDDSRESDMLAVLASCGLEQVILVTHSDLADTFASNVVQI